MKNLSGYLTARLADKEENYENQLIDEINLKIKPPRPVGPGDVYIRAMYIVSDQVNSQGGRFAEEELERLTELLVDSPVMVGHKRDSLPLARNFLAQKVEIDGRTWVKSYFYWMKESEGAEDLKNNIDGGIYKECSVSFLFALPECSICEKDIRECHHVPFHEYEIESGRREIAHFKYRTIEKVLETSLVFRGAVPDTRITDRLSSSPDKFQDRRHPMAATHFFKVHKAAPAGSENNSYGRARLQIETAADFEPNNSIKSLYVSPYQPGLDIRIVKHGGEIELNSVCPLPDEVRRYLTDSLAAIRGETYTVEALLYAVKGKRRLNGLGLMQIIHHPENLHRLRLKICDVRDLDGKSFEGLPYGERINRFRDLSADTEHKNIEVKKYRFLKAEDWIKDVNGGDCASHNFGIEVLAEDAAGSLMRHILSDEKLTVAIIGKVSSGSRGQLFCDLKPLDLASEVSGIICPPLPGLDPGTITLLGGKRLSGGKRRAGSLYDILPGIKSDRICETCHANADKGVNLHLVREGDRLRLFFPESNRLRSVVLYHYSTRLFERGRRFIGDMLAEDYSLLPLPDGETAPLQAVTRSRNLILLRLDAATPAFGNKLELWLRPVMLDGRERYLFYGGGISNLPGEL